MELFGKIVGIAIIAVLALPVYLIIGVAMGGVTGIVIGWAFPYVFDAFRELSGLNYTNFQLGATLGVFGAFFHSHNIG